MALKLRFRLYHLLWNIVPREQIVIEGVVIPYVTLPSWWLRESMTITRGPDTQMIFMRRSEKVERHTIYHEYTESCAMLRIGLFSDRQKMFEAIQEACNAIKEDIPDIEERLTKYVLHTDDRPHAFALVMELALAKRELEPAAYERYYQYAVEHRLFQPPE